MLKFVLRYKVKLLLVVFGVIGSSLCSIYMAFVFKHLVDNISRPAQVFYTTAIFSILFMVASTLIKLWMQYMKSLYMKSTMIHVKKEIFHYIVRKNVAHFASSNSAKYVSILTNDLKMVEDDYFKNIFLLLGTVSSFVFAIIGMFAISYKLVLYLIVMALLSALIPRCFGKTLSALKKQCSDTLEKFTIKVSDIFSGFEVVKSFGIERKIEHEHATVNEDVENTKYRFNIRSSYVDAISEVFGGFIFMSIFIICGYLVMQGEITLGAMIAGIQLTNSVVNPIYMSIQHITRIKSMQDISKKITNIVSSVNPVKPIDSALSEVSFLHSIRFENVSFSYDDKIPSLEKINLVIEKSKKYAFVGVSGSGKSTFLKLLRKEYENYTGKIEVDGCDLKEISSEDVYQFQSVLHQKPFLFDSTVRDNVTLFQPYTDEEIAEAIKIAGLQELLHKLPYGLDSLVGENGNLISGGERQRIALARTVIRRMPLLVLDEATSSLDNETAVAVEDSILNLENVTCVVVTHRLIPQLLSRYDEIIVMRDGRIVEQGAFDKLIQQKRHFYNLYCVANASLQDEKQINPDEVVGI
ncbi:ABC transporter ATP-binding protein [Paenibacillus sp. FSL M8-0228]|uniref:ABC transporter ATP-binding protein n=1 Tax=Paenibacillus TaxID=44249 RepID=UPI00083CD79A|nr:ABC transporter ATP-binding protein [Paenibacillus polymyxa]MBO3283177.1 ABC transporter ATP-binding protein [Paenibacillus polymyxa]ODB56782.1 hypothetical protein A7311_00195 [Paenibacillus polymyxa]